MIVCTLWTDRSSRFLSEGDHWDASLCSYSWVHLDGGGVAAVDARRRRSFESSSLTQTTQSRRWDVQTRQQLATITTTVRSHRRQSRTGRTTATTTAQQPAERVAKVSVEARVDDGIEGGVGVADPEQYGDAPVRQLRTRVPAQSRCQVPSEERKETDEERAHDDAQCLGGLMLSLHRSTLARSFAIERGRRPTIQRRDAESAGSAGRHRGTTVHVRRRR